MSQWKRQKLQEVTLSSYFALVFAHCSGWMVLCNFKIFSGCVAAIEKVEKT
jgi:hypothetical protein